MNIHEPRRIRTFPGKLDDIKLMLDSRFVQWRRELYRKPVLRSGAEGGQRHSACYNGESVPVSARKLKETRTAFTNYVGDNYDDMDDILSATDPIIN